MNSYDVMVHIGGLRSFGQDLNKWYSCFSHLSYVIYIM